MSQSDPQNALVGPQFLHPKEAKGPYAEGSLIRIQNVKFHGESEPLILKGNYVLTGLILIKNIFFSLLWLVLRYTSG